MEDTVEDTSPIRIHGQNSNYEGSGYADEASSYEMPLVIAEVLETLSDLVVQPWLAFTRKSLVWYLAVAERKGATRTDISNRVKLEKGTSNDVPL